MSQRVRTMQPPGLYGIMKGRSYGIAQIASDCSNAEAQARGFADLFEMIMSDSDHARQATFLLLLPSTIPAEAHRRILLDGMAKEYADCEDWMDYAGKDNG